MNDNQRILNDINEDIYYQKAIKRNNPLFKINKQ